MSRKLLIAGNWKLNKSIKEAEDLVVLLKRKLYDVQSVEIVICPVYTALAHVADLLTDSNLGLGAQDLYWEEKGAFTGQVSGSLIKEAGASYVIIGHSERRQFFHETDETVNKKLKAALKNSLIPIVCVGESLKEREANDTFRVVDTQIKGGLANLTAAEMATVVIAYEPVWAIGTGKVATPQQAEEVHGRIRSQIAQLFNEEVAKNIRILYGGSVKADNASSLMAQANIDGALVGGASLEADSFAEIVKNSAAVGVK